MPNISRRHFLRNASIGAAATGVAAAGGLNLLTGVCSADAATPSEDDRVQRSAPGGIGRDRPRRRRQVGKDLASSSAPSTSNTPTRLSRRSSSKHPSEGPSATRIRTYPPRGELNDVVTQRSTGHCQRPRRRQYGRVCVRQPGRPQHGHHHRQLRTVPRSRWWAELLRVRSQDRRGHAQPRWVTTCSTRSTSTTPEPASLPSPTSSSSPRRSSTRTRSSTPPGRSPTRRAPATAAHGTVARPTASPRSSPTSPRVKARSTVISPPTGFACPPATWASGPRRTTQSLSAPGDLAHLGRRDRLRRPAGRRLLRGPRLHLRPRRSAADLHGPPDPRRQQRRASTRWPTRTCTPSPCRSPSAR